MSVERRGNTWVARWRDPDGKQRSKGGFKRKSDAESHQTAMRHSILAGSYIDPAAAKVTLKAYAEQWRTAQVHRKGTASQIETNLRLHVYPRLGARRIGGIRKSDVQGLVKALVTGDDSHKPLAAGTVNLIYAWVSTIFKSAQQDRIISESPCHGVRLPQIEAVKIVPLKVEVVEALIESIPPRYRALLVLGAGTGVRISEALGLTNDRIDWLRRTMTVDRQLAGIVDNKPAFGPVKDRQNRPRTIPLPAVVLDALAEHVAQHGLGPQDLLFTGATGGPVRRTTFSDAWVAVAGPLGVPLGDGFHQLRHFYASLLIHHGESVKVVQERLGHASAMETLDTYGHLWPDSEDSTRQAIDSVLGVQQLDGVDIEAQNPEQADPTAALGPVGALSR